MMLTVGILVSEPKTDIYTEKRDTLTTVIYLK
jgi:hypothetical protein